jgi:hypothetical protein
MIIKIIERKAQLAVAELSDDQLKALWLEIIKTAVYITNRTATLSLGLTPIELLSTD